MKTVLITGGGTQVPLDNVRFIGNFSKGRFASRIAEACLKHEQVSRVIYLASENAYRPTEYNRNNHILEKQSFRTYDEYYSQLQYILKHENIDYVFLAAAVSDYGPADKVDGKISSDKEELVIRLKPLPKIIKLVKDWSKNKKIIQVGFKLLDGVSEEDLIKVAKKALVSNKSEYVIANDYRTVVSRKHQVILVSNDKTEKYNVEKFSEIIRLVGAILI